MEAHVPISVPFFFLFAMHTDDVSSTLRQCSQRMLYYYYRYCLKMTMLVICSCQVTDMIKKFKNLIKYCI